MNIVLENSFKILVIILLMQNKIKEYLELENNILEIKSKLLEYKKYILVLNFDYFTDISFNYNYDYYHSIPKIKNLYFIKNDMITKIHILNKISKQKLDLEFLNRQNIIKLNLLKNQIIDFIPNQNIKKYISKRKFPKPIKKLNKPETIIYNYLLYLQNQNKSIILIIPQYTLPVKFKKNLYADFFIIIYNNKQIFPVIIEFDGIQHYTKNFFFQQDRIYCDIIKNNFSIANSISIIRGRNIEHLKNTIQKCITFIIKKKKPFYHIPTYQSYFDLIS